MKIKVTLNLFISIFNSSQYKDRFSTDGLKALFAHLKSVEIKTGRDMDLDLFEIASQYYEFDDLESLNDAYWLVDVEQCLDEGYSATEAIKEEFRAETDLIEVGKGASWIVKDF